MNIIHIASAGLLVLLAGCTGDGGSSNLAFDGQGNGSHSDTAGCDDQGTIRGSGAVPDGSVVVTLKDSTGKQLFQQTFSDTFTLDEKALSGASGTWTIDARRTGDDLVGDSFSGKYDFTVDC